MPSAARSWTRSSRVLTPLVGTSRTSTAVAALTLIACAEPTGTSPHDLLCTFQARDPGCGIPGPAARRACADVGRCPPPRHVDHRLGRRPPRVAGGNGPLAGERIRELGGFGEVPPSAWRLTSGRAGSGGADRLTAEGRRSKRRQPDRQFSDVGLGKAVASDGRPSTAASRLSGSRSAVVRLAGHSSSWTMVGFGGLTFPGAQSPDRLRLSGRSPVGNGVGRASRVALRLRWCRAARPGQEQPRGGRRTGTRR